MTREEAIEYAESKKMRLEALVYNDDCKYGNYAMYSGELSFVNAALTALRPVSREQVEKVWPGCPYCKEDGEGYVQKFGAYSIQNGELTTGHCKPQKIKFCPHCSRPLTDEAVEMVMKRMETIR